MDSSILAYLNHIGNNSPDSSIASILFGIIDPADFSDGGNILTDSGLAENSVE